MPALAHFKDCRKLTSLHIQTRNVTDTGLANLRGLKLRSWHRVLLPLPDTHTGLLP